MSRYFTTRVVRVGNSLYAHIPKHMARILELDVDTIIKVEPIKEPSQYTGMERTL